MISTPKYAVELRIDGVLLGDVRKLCQNLTWTRRRTIFGVDSISFSINDKLLSEWLSARNTTISEVLRPIALDCRIVRNGVAMVGGFLATMPAYNPNGTSATLDMQFDGYLNLLEGVLIHPTATQTMRMGAMVKSWITMADSRAASAGKAFGFASGSIQTLANVEQTFDGYITVKQAISNRADNITGAGKFDVVFHADRTYDIIGDSAFGNARTYIIKYPTAQIGISASSISASEVSGFASHITALGSGETSSDPLLSTVITADYENSEAVQKYGYVEKLYQNSSVSNQTTLNGQAQSELANLVQIQWTPEITLSSTSIAPGSEEGNYIWIGDRITIENSEDLTGQTSGKFRVQELNVSVSETNAETIKPTLERI